MKFTNRFSVWHAACCVCLLLCVAGSVRGTGEDPLGQPAADRPQPPEAADQAWERAIKATVQMQNRQLAEYTPRPALLRGVDDAGQRRALCVRWLGRVFAPGVDPQHRSEMVQALRYAMPEHPDLLVELLDHDDAQLRRFAVGGLAQLSYDEAAEPMIRAIEQDKDTKVRVLAAEWIAGFRDRAAVPALARALADADPHVRRSAATSIARLGGVEAFGDVAAAFERDLAIEKNRRTLGVVLVELDRPRARRLFERLLAQDRPDTTEARNLERRLSALLKQEPGFFLAYAPLDAQQRFALRTARHAMHIRAELFGEAEIRALTEHATDPAIGDKCVEALGHLRATEAQGELIRAMKAQRFHNDLSTILKLGGEKAWRMAVDSYRSEQAARELGLDRLGIALAIAKTGKPGVPILMRMIDDPALLTEKKPFTDRTGRNAFLPPRHMGMVCLGEALDCLDSRPQDAPWASGYIGAERERVRRWWAAHASDFIAGRPTPDPPTVTDYNPLIMYRW